MEELLTSGVLAREVECSGECIRDLERRDIIHGRRDSDGRRIFNKTAVDAIKAYKRSRGNTASKNLMEMR